MAVYANNIVIPSGCEFQLPLTIMDSGGDAALNLTGYAVTSMMRKHAESSSLSAQFVVGITSAADGEIILSLASTTTAALKEGRYVYDVMLTSNTNSKSIAVEGTALVRVGITS
jgi:hypothetical protein